jgi:arylsulfatase
MKKQILATLALGLSSAGTAFADSAVPDPAKPNVIIILSDDQGYGDFSCHGHPVVKTPALDKLHAQSVRFTDFHVAPICTPTRSQLMTGRDALANGAYCVCSGHEFIDPKMPTMPEVFKSTGYRTGLFGKWHLGDSYPYRPQDRGFDDVLSFKGYGLDSTATYWDTDHMDPFLHDNQDCWRQEKGYCTDVYFRQAMAWMKQCAAKKQPFMLYLPPNAPHWPYQVEKKYRAPYIDKVGERVAAFYGCIANLDENIAHCDTFLKESGLYDNTIVILMTDNGTTEECTSAVYNAGMREPKGSYYDGGHRVPCFIRWPAGKLRVPGDIATTAQVQDILPTLIELCGLQAPQNAKFDGASLAPLLRNRRAPDLDGRMFVIQCARWYETSGPTHGDGVVLWDKWRLINKNGELYDLRNDLGQQHNVAAKHPDIAAKMRAHYETWWSQVEPLAREYPPTHLGSNREKITLLTSHCWLDTNTADQKRIREGEPRNGAWPIMVETAGEYEIALRRWPVETGQALTASVPPFVSKVADGEADARQDFNRQPPGLALPIASARLKVGAFDETQAAARGAQAVTFHVTLPAGRTTLQTWFSDRNGKPLCGAYFVYVKKVAP